VVAPDSAGITQTVNMATAVDYDLAPDNLIKAQPTLMKAGSVLSWALSPTFELCNFAAFYLQTEFFLYLCAFVTCGNCLKKHATS
jgi:hypothetical protein